ncbi:hypothetical protein mvi_60500 (plasmid) [Methylobacterium indicum]|uniref:Uncharacterized protein n=1 Tax=Methylobacterium indicum TaxID=1775910 RepID=A0A8H8X079_9HYPH|nr:hypothetical protein [Methylobacterium indicum]BCM87589.1 hypothetical protein mvi_60500 [Methylobacterium indicum]
MPAIRDLLRLVSTDACTSGILGRAIPCDEFDIGVPFEPSASVGAVLREEVDHMVTVEVDADRTVVAALPDRPTVDPDPDRSGRVGHRQAGNEPQHGRAACRHVQVREETRAA